MTLTEEGIRVNIPFIELVVDQRRVSPVCKEAYLMLYEKYLQYKIVANYSSVDNAEGVLTQYKCNNRKTWLREDIGCVEMFKDNKHDTWAVHIEFKACSDSGPEWDFINAADAKVLYDTLVEYFISR